MPNRPAIVLIIAFCIIFAGYNAAQQYLSAVFHSSGAEAVAFVSLSIIYLSLAAANFMAPRICRRLGLKKSLFFSSLAYPVYIAAVSVSSEWAIYASSVLIGVAGAVLWTAHGTYLMKVTNEKDRGFYSGLSFSLLNLGSTLMVFGASFFIEATGRSVTYAIFAVVALVGSLSLLMLTVIKGSEEKSLSPIRLVKQKRMLLLVVFIFSVSLGSGLMAGSIPVRMTDLYGLSMMGRLAGMYLFLTFLVPLVVGWLLDRHGIKAFAYLAVISQIVGFALMLSFQSVLLFGMGLALLAYANGSYMAAIYPIITVSFKRDVDSAMAIRMTAMSLAVVAAIASSGVVSFFIQGIALIIFSLLSLVTLYLFFRT